MFGQRDTGVVLFVFIGVDVLEQPVLGFLRAPNLLVKSGMI